MKKCSKCNQFFETIYFNRNIKSKDGLNAWCKQCVSLNHLENKKRFPWKYILKYILTRTNNQNHFSFTYCGYKGVKCLISEEEIKQLWFRDKAYEMKQPSIDRIDKDGHYIFSNCQFIEMKENSAKDKRKSVLQFTKEGKFLKQWNSIKEASIQFKIVHQNISQVVFGQRKTAGGYIWKAGS